jgi:hypothetical protein
VGWAHHLWHVERKKLQDELQDDDDEELDDDEDEALILDHGDEEDVYDEDTAIRDVMAREVGRRGAQYFLADPFQAERLQLNAAKLSSGEDVYDEDIDSDEDIEEELGYISPLDSVDPYLAFKRSLSSTYLTIHDGQSLSHIYSLPDEESFRLSNVDWITEY